jgi:hypothetical protein
MTGDAAIPPEDPTPPDGVPTPPTGLPTAPAAAAEVPGSAPAGATTPRRLQAVPDAYPTVVTGVRTGAFGRPIGKHRPTALHRLVEAARVLTGGLMGLAAWRRTPVWAATVAALVVPVDVLVVLAIFWWR